MKRKMQKVNGKDLSVVYWDNVATPIATVQILHGMSEHIERYDDFAKALNKAGYIVIGADQRAHGYTDKENLGKVGDTNLFEDSVQDAIELTAYAKVKYRLPVIVFGHSYGSFLLQRYLSYTSSQIHGAVLCGSACMEGFIVNLSCLLTNGKNKPKSRDKAGKLFANMTFGSYDKKYKKEGLNAWLSRDYEQVKKYNDDPMCGFTCSMGFYHYFFRGFKAIQKSEHKKLRKDLPLLIISGADDKVGGDGKLVKKLDAKYRKLGLNPTLKLYDGARHELLNEINRHEVYEDVINFVKSCLPL
ncbi:MAG: alpha/beta hydrolase [Clostridia bacterium]|nr:alpha/beta hydrolase [Clostridia bacterium]